MVIQIMRILPNFIEFQKGYSGDIYVYFSMGNMSISLPIEVS